MDLTFRTRRAALRAVFHEMRRRVNEADTLCVKLYKSLDVISLFEMRGRSKLLIGRFSWKERA